MKRYSIALLALATILLTSVGAWATVPNGDNHVVFPKPDGCQTFKLNQGWLGSGEPVWYICTDTSDIDFARCQKLTLAPKLIRGFYGAGVGALFLVTNPVLGQGPVFEAAPGASQYSGIWRVRLVTWIDLDARVPLTSIGQILDLRSRGKLDYEESDIRVDYPIIAVGQLGCKLSCPRLRYTIPQAKALDVVCKRVTLPTWRVYCADCCTKKVSVGRIIVPDVEDRFIAMQIGANFAPQLAGWGNSQFQLDGTMKLFYMLDPKPCNQFPVEEACPSSFSVANRCFDYSPVQRVIVLERKIPPGSVINNPDTVEMLICQRKLCPLQFELFINAPVIPCW